MNRNASVLLGNVYIRLLEHGEFDLSSMVAGEMANLGLTAIEEKNTELVDIIIIRFNTLLRFAIKHGVRNNEPRNLYNLGFYYGNFIRSLVEYKKTRSRQALFHVPADLRSRNL